jgi:hypothetical protein
MSEPAALSPERIADLRVRVQMGNARRFSLEDL